LIADFQMYHVPVLLAECIDALAIRPDGTYVDATLGGGGHLKNIIANLSGKGLAVGIDRDPNAISYCKEILTGPGCKVVLVQSPFSQISKVLAANNINAVDGVLLDLGVSSHQIDEANRGFSYMQNAALDMRMDQTCGETAAQLLINSDEETLASILSSYGEITNPARMAKAIKAYAVNNPLETSADLRACLKAEYGPNLPIKVFAKVFQAIRIAVNDELNEISQCLEGALKSLKIGGRLAVISYHSLEDRIVKMFIRAKEQSCTCPPRIPYCICNGKTMLKRINKKVIVPSDAEIQNNPRSRSAKLRIAQKVGD